MLKRRNYEYVATAAANTLELTKFAGGRVIIRRISTWGAVDRKFGHHYGYLEEIGATESQLINLYNKWPVQTKLQGVTLFEGSVEWPENFKMILKTKTQTAADWVNYTIEYEVVAEEKAKPWWGF